MHNVKIILIFILKEFNARAWAGLIWLRIETSDWLL
jgi:hypothetical protein